MAISETPSPLARVLASKTYNALWFQQTGFTSEQAISTAIAQAASDFPAGGAFVYVPALLFPYNIANVALNPIVSLVQESSVLAGYGTPEGVYPAPVGWLYQQLDAVGGAILWQKNSGTGNTGWVLLTSTAVTDISPITQITNRFLDMEAFWAGVNNGDTATLSSVIPGFSRSFSATSLTPTMFQGTAGSQVPLLFVSSDGRRGASWLNSGFLGVNCVWRFAPNVAGYTNALPFIGPTYPTSTGTLGTTFDSPQFGFSTSISAWCRKLNGGDGSSCRMGLGYANNTTTSGSATIPRVGLLGDGAGGYRYGSVNCPDGGLSGNNADNAIDANSVQPADLVSPGVNWWHTRIKLIPATPTSGAKIACYHNFSLVATFTSATNFPRGHQSTNDNYGRIEATIWNLSGDTGGLHVPELVISELRVVHENDFTV